jgi:hypothetical protein
MPTGRRGSVIWLNGSDTSNRWGGGDSTFKLWSAASNHFTAVSHTQPDPWTIVTVYNAGTSGVQLTETVSYTNGNGYYKIKWDVNNAGSTTYNDIRFMNGEDTTFWGDDNATGYWDDPLKMVYIRNPGASGIMGFYADSATPASHHYENTYNTVRTQCMSGNRFPDTVNGSFIDAGYALEWDRASLAPSETWSITAYEKWTAAGNVQVYAPSERTGNPGDTVTLPFTVQSFQPTSDTFNLAATSANGWVVSAPATVSLNSNESKIVDVQVTIPGGATPGQTDQVTLEATSQSNPAIKNHDHATVRVNNVTTHTITASAGANGSISPSGAVSVNNGADQTFNITPAAHYHVDDVVVDGTTHLGSVTSHTFTNVTATHTIDATFAIDTFDITVGATTNGSISPSGVVPVDYGVHP